MIGQNSSASQIFEFLIGIHMLLQRSSALVAITALEFSSDGSILFVGSGSHVYIYNTTSGVLLLTIEALKGGTIHGIQINRDGYAVVYGQKQLAVYRNVPLSLNQVDLTCSFVLHRNFNAFSDWIHDVQFLNDASRLAIGFAHNFIQVWDIKTSELMHELHCSVKCILYSLAFYGETLEQLIVASGTVFQQVLLWDATGNGTPTQRLEGHDGVLFHLEWSKQGHELISVSDDRTIQLWTQESVENTKDKILSTAFSSAFRSYGHTSRIWNAKFCSKGIVTSSEDATCKVWNKNGECIATIKGHSTRHVWSIAVHPTYDILATGGGDAAVKLWNLDQQIQTPSQLLELSPPGASAPTIRSIRIMPDGQTAIVLSDQGNVWRIYLHHSKPEWTAISSSLEPIPYCTLDFPTERPELLFLADSRGHVYLMDAKTGDIQYTWRPHTARIMMVDCREYCSDAVVYTSGIDGLLCKWQMIQGEMQLVDAYQCPTKYTVTSFLKLDDYLICGDGRGNLMVFQHRSNESPAMPLIVCRHVHGRDQVTKIATKDGMLYSSGIDGSLCTLVFDTRTLRVVDRQSISGISSIQTFWWDEITSDLYVLGHHGPNALVYNHTKEYLVLSKHCASRKRPLSLWTSERNKTSCTMEYIFIFSPPIVKGQPKCSSKASIWIHRYNNTLPIDLSTDVFHARFHDRLVSCSAWLDDQILVTGSEDNKVQIHEWDNSNQLPRRLQSSLMHTAGIRSLCTLENYVVTTGGKQTICFWKWNGSRRHLDHLHTYTVQDSTQDQRIAASVLLPHCRIVAGDSEGTLRLLDVDEGGIQLTAELNIRSKPVLCMARMSQDLVITGYSDGWIELYRITKEEILPVASYKAHALGVNCISESSGRIVSGGDDQALCIATYDRNGLGEMKIYPQALGSAVQCVAIQQDWVLACGYDQRLNVWRLDGIALSWETGQVVQVGDVASLSISRTQIALGGIGLQMVNLYM